MVASYVIVRYVIVKPVKHLRDVSDAIAAGKLTIRSQIQTGDEFEELSHAFNRMLHNLVAMQQELREVNGDLDRKVDELAQANLALFEMNRLKSDFLATMSHELRTPLNSIIGFSEVLAGSDQLSDRQKRYATNIQTSGKMLLGMINDILDLAKIESGKMEVRTEDFSIRDVCEGLAALARPIAERKNIDLECRLDEAIPLLGRTRASSGRSSITCSPTRSSSPPKAGACRSGPTPRGGTSSSRWPTPGSGSPRRTARRSSRSSARRAARATGTPS
jgi:signal transduction histidine kinase